MQLFTIPNLITLANLTCGVLGLISLHEGDLEKASLMIVIALVLDFLDGFVARLTNSYSEIGKQLDSLADMVSFGVLPGLILFYLMKESGFIQYLAFLPILASALRLAKFNIDERQSDSFRGLPTPANALVIASLSYILKENTILKGETGIYICAFYAFIISLLMISDIPMLALKFKSFGWKSNLRRYTFLGASLLILLLLQITGIPIILALYLLLSLLLKDKSII